MTILATIALTGEQFFQVLAQYSWVLLQYLRVLSQYLRLLSRWIHPCSSKVSGQFLNIILSDIKWWLLKIGLNWNFHFSKNFRQIDEFFGERGCNGTPKIYCKNTLQNSLAKILCKILCKIRLMKKNVTLTEKLKICQFDGKVRGCIGNKNCLFSKLYLIIIIPIFRRCS